MSDLPELIAASFALGSPMSDLRPIQAGAQESWRLTTSRGSFMIKRLWRGPDPSWRSEFEVSMELERRAWAAGLPIAVPVAPTEAHFGWAARIGGHGVWRAYEWLDHAASGKAEVDGEWFGDTLARLHGLFPLEDQFQPEWRWLGVYPRGQWQRWLDAAGSGKPWVPVVASHLDDMQEITEGVRSLYEGSTDHIVSHRDFGPWNVLQTAAGFVLIDWENAGPTTAWTELGRALTAFAGDSQPRMGRLLQAYTNAGGTVSGQAADLFNWQVTQQLSQITERIKIAVGDLDDEDDPDPVWMTAATIDHDIVEAVTTLRGNASDLSRAALRLLGT